MPLREVYLHRPMDGHFPPFYSGEKKDNIIFERILLTECYYLLKVDTTRSSVF